MAGVYLSHRQDVFDAQQATVTDLPLVFRQQLKEDVHRHGDSAVRHVAEGHAQRLGAGLPDRRHHLEERMNCRVTAAAVIRHAHTFHNALQSWSCFYILHNWKAPPSTALAKPQLSVVTRLARNKNFSGSSFLSRVPEITGKESNVSYELPTQHTLQPEPTKQSLTSSDTKSPNLSSAKTQRSRITRSSSHS